MDAVLITLISGLRRLRFLPFDILFPLPLWVSAEWSYFLNIL